MEWFPLSPNFPIRSCWLCLCSCAAASCPWGHHWPCVRWDRTHLLPCCVLEMQLVYQKSSRGRLYHLVECKICHIGTLTCLRSNPSMSSTVTPGKSFNVSSHPSQTNAPTTSMSRQVLPWKPWYGALMSFVALHQSLAEHKDIVWDFLSTDI